MTDEELARLQRRADRTFGGNTIGTAIGPVKAIVGPRMPHGQDDAERAREKLAKKPPQTPTPRERAALEVMIRLLRPTLLCRSVGFDNLSATNQYTAELQALWAAFLSAIGAFTYSVGRIDTEDRRPLGTAFLVSENRIVTNHHVLEALSYGTFELERGQGTIQFQWRWEPANSEDPADITRVIAYDAVLDIAVLEIAPPQGFAHAPFQFDDLDPVDGDWVAVVGYPTHDRNNRNPAFTDVLFEGKYDVKRAAPGEIVGVVDPIAFHDCSTLGNSSGSPVLSLKSAKVVGLHRSGRFMYRNEAVRRSALQEFIGAH